MPKIDTRALPVRTGTSYPEPYASLLRGRAKQVLGDAVGLTQFGVNLLHLPPGAVSSQRHWHREEDEFVIVLSGEVILEEDDGETVLSPHDCAGFPAGRAVGHRLANRSEVPATVLEIGTRAREDVSTYTDPDVDMQAVKSDGGGWRILRKDGTAYGG